ncbi:MAG: SMP-30/gluconolactonase/LRE family protein [Planctomycetota bacterium]|nr:SMP-30/gluconolactonase/LRE family protein [Planctomycetota bacterium]
MRYRYLLAAITLIGCATQMQIGSAAELPADDQIKAVELFKVPAYCEGVVFDHDGNGYVSWKKSMTKFSLDGMNKVWVETGSPNGHKVLADGTHLVCDGTHNAILHLDADGKLLPHASQECNGKKLRGPNDLTLDTPNDGFYFTDPGGSEGDNHIGTVHYVDSKGKTHLIDDGLAFPNGIVLRPDGKTLLVAESKKNRILVYKISAPGKASARQVFIDLPEKDTTKGQIDNQPDGMCLDVDGNLYVAHYGMKQVQVIDPTGKLIRRYDGGNLTTSNVAFGGPKHDQLFVTGGIGSEKDPSGGLFRLDLGVPGVKILPAKKN